MLTNAFPSVLLDNNQHGNVATKCISMLLHLADNCADALSFMQSLNDA